jgi:hypothetical protein
VLLSLTLRSRSTVHRCSFIFARVSTFIFTFAVLNARYARYCIIVVEVIQGKDYMKQVPWAVPLATLSALGGWGCVILVFVPYFLALADRGRPAQVCVYVCVLSHWVHVAIGEWSDLPSVHPFGPIGLYLASVPRCSGYVLRNLGSSHVVRVN